MIKPVVLSASLFLLTSCATPSSPVEPIERPAPLAADPRLCAPVKAEPPVLGTIVAPVTDQERADTRDFLNGEAEARAWGREGWSLVALAQRSFCRL